MDEKYEKHDLSDPSLEGQETLHEPLAEATYHDTDVFGHEEDHDVCDCSRKMRSNFLFVFREITRSKSLAFLD